MSTKPNVSPCHHEGWLISKPSIMSTSQKVSSRDRKAASSRVGNDDCAAAALALASKKTQPYLFLERKKFYILLRRILIEMKCPNIRTWCTRCSASTTATSIVKVLCEVYQTLLCRNRHLQARLLAGEKSIILMQYYLKSHNVHILY